MQEEISDLQLSLRTMNRQLNCMSAASQQSSTASALTDPTFATSNPAIKNAQSAIRGLVEGRQALEAQVQELTERCNGMGAANEELR